MVVLVKYVRRTGCKNGDEGIANNILKLLVEDARSRGIHAISLEATQMGRPLYEKFGFVKMNDEMEYPC